MTVDSATFPSGATTTNEGIHFTPYSLATSASRIFLSSLHWGYLMSYFSTAVCQRFLSVSNETPRNTTPLSEKSLYRDCISGISRIQSGHHDAQKSNTTYLPLKSDNEMVLPSSDESVKSGATVPAFGSSVAYFASRSSWALIVCMHNMNATKNNVLAAIPLP